MPGFSDELLLSHLELYGGYVKATCELHNELEVARRDGTSSAPRFAELRRRLGWEFDGMRLHELYFDGMTTRPTRAEDAAPSFLRKAGQSFGSFGAWADDFKVTGGMRGIGWAAAVWDPGAECLFNVWIDEHHVGHLAGCPVLLVMDVFEHAFTRDYGTKKADYIEAFFTAVDWSVVESRFAPASRLMERTATQASP
jgi:Fe-Mn family superoxide dismutase